MKLTGKLKEEFDEWLYNYYTGFKEVDSITSKLKVLSFDNLDDYHKIGIYQMFFIKYGIFVEVNVVEYYWNKFVFKCNICYENKRFEVKSHNDNIVEFFDYSKAFESAVRIVNRTLNKHLNK